ncbi:MAG: S8 family serine peptidase [Planctomycetaceae bacterium]|nr:S8 family serine peptidase [Planctomycetaceae bacterium]
MSRQWNEAFEKNARFETLEDRIVLSADALTNFATLDIEHTATDQIQTSNVSLNQVHQQTGVNHIHQNYGFRGDGQTVVVIDSGIAWDHYALGGGYGQGYRVVGGWDFAHNDSNPFDGGAAGFHGTHVAGIIGSSDANNLGVASGVDLVALRVFSDTGSGSLEHVRQALAWVNNNINTFENPITTVNLSLGTNWNSNQVPFWANLESEFAQLEAKGVFISVAAGNSFQSFQSVGVSYPAASSHVVPVSSHSQSGVMSSFSQRNDRVLVAPGEGIRSTVPGHLFGSGPSTQFLAASGTSMAAPYVAGASVLMREAMEFMGYENISQDAIYDQLRETANRVFDSVTGLTYHHINLRAAMESVVTDLHGDTVQTATSIGTLQGGEQLAGTIGTFNDQDVMQFTAGRSGTMTFTFQQTHELSLLVQLNGQAATLQGNTLTFDVVAGQNYTLSLATSSGIGHYTITSSIQLNSIQATDLGTVFGRSVEVQNSGEQWYQMTAGRHGVLAFQLPGLAGQNANLQVFNAQQQLLGQATINGNSVVFQTQAQAGQTFFVRLQGEFSGTLQLQNLVTLHNGTLTVNGTNQADQVEIRDGAQVAVNVNGVEYSFARSSLTRVQVFAHGGQNQLNLVQSNVGNQTAHIHHNQVYVVGGNYVVIATQVQNVNFHGHALDNVRMYDSTGDDTFTARAGHSEMQGAGYHNQVFGVGRVVGVASSGSDRAIMHGTSGNDFVYSNPTFTTLTSPQHWTLAREFDHFEVHSNGGADLVAAFGSNSDESLTVQPGFSRFQSATLNRDFHNFQSQQFFAVGGQDQATLHGGSQGNSLDAYWNRAFFTSGQQTTFLSGFRSVTATGNQADRAILFDSVGNDRFDADAGWGRMEGAGFNNQAVGFGLTIARYSSGQDVSNFHNVSNGVQTSQQSGRSSAVYAGNYQVRSVGNAVVNLSTQPFGVPATSAQSFASSGNLANRVQAFESRVTVLGLGDGLRPDNFGATLSTARTWVSSNTTVQNSIAANSANPWQSSSNSTAHSVAPSPMSRNVEAVFENLGADNMAVVTLRPSSQRVTGSSSTGLDAANELSRTSDQQILNQLVDDFFATL